MAERRVTSVLFGDLVGFTPLSESKDSEEVRELLSAYFQHCRVIVGRYGGVIEKFIGDAVMAVWGVPVAHEDDAERAVRAGLELVAMVATLGDEVGAPGLAQRVGIVTGEVAVTVGATAEGMVAGDAVNTAARVQSAATPGRVWVDETTRGLASAAITFTDTGEHDLKGKAEPVRLWQAGIVVAEVGGGQRLDGLEAPFTGRDADLRLVKELFHATQEAGRPRLVVLDGEAGVGKSRLAWEFEKYVDGLTAPTRWHRGRCLSYGDGVAFWALAEAIRARLGLVEADTGKVVTEHLDAGLQQYVPDMSERAWLRPRAAVLLGEPGSSSFPREDLFAAWMTFLEHLAADGATVVLVIDDAQYADDGLLDFIDHVLAAARAAIFVLALARPELMLRRPDLGGRRTGIVRLEPLDDDAMGTLVGGLVDLLPKQVRSALVERAEGIPLYAVETVRALVDRDLVVPVEGRYVVAAGADLDLDTIGPPASLHALIAARLDTLSTDEKRVVSDAAVLGLTFTRAGLLALGSLEPTVDRVLEALRRREIVAVQTDRFSAERGQYRFVQSAVRQVAYATLSKRDRKARHLAAAEHLASEPDPSDALASLIAQHLLDAIEAAPDSDPDVPDLHDRALGYLEAAGSRSLAIGAPAEAQRQLAAALDQTGDPATRARLHLAAADASDNAGHYRVALEHARAARALYDQLGDDLLAGRALAAEAVACMSLGDAAQAIQLAEPAWRALDGRPEADTTLIALGRSLAHAHRSLGDHETAVRLADRVLYLAEGANDPDAMASAMLHVGTHYVLTGAPAMAQILFRGVADFARERGLVRHLGAALIDLYAMQSTRELSAASAYAAEALEVARRVGRQGMISVAIINRIIDRWQAGDLETMASAIADAMDTVTGTDLLIALPTLELWLAEATGRDPSSSGKPTPATDDVMVLAWFESARVARALHAGDHPLAAAMAADTFAHMLSSIGLEDDFFILWPPLVRAALAAGDLQLADRFLQPVERGRPGQRSPAIEAQWHRLRGLVSAARGDDPEFAETEMRTGISALDDFGAVGYHAQAQEELARWLVEQHRPDDAQPLIDAARTTYTDIGATGWLARLDAWDTSRQPSRTP